jgi:hypothetical protein
MYRLKARADFLQLHCHLLRHTFTNHLIGNDGDLRKLQKILGHANIQTAAEIYTDPGLAGLEEHAKVSPLSQLRKGLGRVNVSFPNPSARPAAALRGYLKGRSECPAAVIRSLLNCVP